jgi:glycerol-3-phosphate dehydrogenase (NAD(P)+)
VVFGSRCAPVTVAVLGAGSWGTTVASLLAQRTPTALWARSARVADELRRNRTNSAYLGPFEVPAAVRATAALGEALDAAEVVVLAIPSHGLRRVLVEAAPHVHPHAIVLSLTKGLEEHTMARMTEVVAECWPGCPVGVLTGPNLAQEVCAGQPTASVIAYADEDLAVQVRDLFVTDTLRIYTNPDVTGCEIAGVVKNVMAIASGMAIGLGLGDNTRAALITRSLAELTRLGVSLGGDPPTFAGLAGLGDLVATCTSAKSRNFSVGVALGKGKTLAEATGSTPMVAEGVRSCRPVLELANRRGVEVPVAEQVVAVCHGGRSPKEAIPILMRRAPKSEIDPLVFGADR